MKNTIKIIILLLLPTISWGQRQGDGAGVWGSYTTVSCFPNLKVSFKCNGWSQAVNRYSWSVKFKNTSSQNMHFDFDAKTNSTGERFTADGRFDIKANYEYIHPSCYLNTPPPPVYDPNFFIFHITRYIENQKDDWTIPSYSCDNAGNKYCDQNCKDGTKSSSSNNTNAQEQYQKEYNTLNELVEKRNALCIELANTVRNANLDVSYYSNYCLPAKSYGQNDIAQLKTDIGIIEKAITDAGGASKQQQKAQQTFASFNQQVDVGRSLYSQGKFNEAKQAFEKAKGYAQNDTQRKYLDGLIGQCNEQIKTQTTFKVAETLISSAFDLAKSIKANKEAKRIREENEAAEWRRLKEQEKQKEQQLKENADNGDVASMKKMLEKSYSNVEYDDAYDYAMKIYRNDNVDDNEKMKILTEVLLITLYPIKGREYLIWEAISQNQDLNYYNNKLKISLILFGDDYFLKPILNDSMKKEAVESIIKNNYLERAYFQITGEYEGFGLAKDIKKGVDVLEKYSDKRHPYYNSLALYYLGLAYEKGYIKGKPNLSKAEDYYKESIFKDKCGLDNSKDLIYIPSKYFTINGLNYFSPSIRSYIGLMRIYSKSTKESEQELYRTMKRNFLDYYENLLSNSDREILGLNKKISPFKMFEEYHFNKLKSNEPVTLNDLMIENKSKKTIIITWSKDWCRPCINDINNLLERGMDKKYNIIVINIDMKTKGKTYESILEYANQNLSDYFKKTTMLYDKDAMLSQFDNEQAPMVWVLDENHNTIKRSIGIGKSNEIK